MLNHPQCRRGDGAEVIPEVVLENRHGRTESVVFILALSNVETDVDAKVRDREVLQPETPLQEGFFSGGAVGQAGGMRLEHSGLVRGDPFRPRHGFGSVRHESLSEQPPARKGIGSTGGGTAALGAEVESKSGDGNSRKIGTTARRDRAVGQSVVGSRETRAAGARPSEIPAFDRGQVFEIADQRLGNQVGHGFHETGWIGPYEKMGFMTDKDVAP